MDFITMMHLRLIFINVVHDICKINLKRHLDNKEHQLGFIFNTDDSDGPGQHWIAYYVDLMSKNFEQPGIYFFDFFWK